MNYKQCRLEKQTKDGLITQTAWIPVQFAKIGKYVKLKESNGWKVMHVGDVVAEWAEVNERSQDYKKQRASSDI